MSFISDLVFYNFGLVVMILVSGEYKECKVPLNLFMIILFSSVVWIRVFAEGVKRNICYLVSTAMVVLGALLLVGCIITSLVFIILIEIYSHRCVKINVLVIDWIIIGIGNAALIISVVLLVLVFLEHRQFVQNQKKTLELLSDIYEKILDPAFDAPKFVHEHEEGLNKYKLSEKETAILRDYCGKEFPQDQTAWKEDDKSMCIICFQHIEFQARVVSHPKCNHTFHEACLMPWYGKDENCSCPICRRGTRTSLILQIHHDIKCKAKFSQENKELPN